MSSDIVHRNTIAERLHEVGRYAREAPGQRLDRARLARVAGFSIPHLHRLFQVHVGESPGRYARRIQLERAGKKLRMGAVDITEVALAAGYATHAAFSKAFKQRYGMSPSRFRELDCWTATQILQNERDT